jgi:hypothetical protein
MFGPGTNRAVVIIGPLAFKFARHDYGMRCNRFEADLYRRTSERRRAMLCPPLWCSRKGRLLIATAARPISESEAAALRASRAFPDWDYVPPDDGCPFEYKAADWGRMNGVLVALDYSATVVDVNDTRTDFDDSKSVG